MLDRYFRRIGYTGASTPSLSTLREIHALHVSALPFENITPFLGEAVLLDRDALVAKMIDRRRGGYCFEQNALFKAVLEELGFQVQGLSARVVWMSTAQTHPRSHMVLLVTTAEGAYIADVGFGGYLLDAPLALVPGVVQKTPTSVYRFEESAGLLILQALINDVWQNAYQFSLDPSFPVDYEMANWYTSTHPKSAFRENLIVQRLSPSVRLRLLNRKLTRRFADGRVEEFEIETPNALKGVLEDELGLELPVSAATIFARF